MTETRLLYAAVVISLFTVAIINLVMMVYVGLFKLKEMESLLENCYLIQANRRENGYGFFSRRYSLNLITAMLSKPPSLLLLDDPRALDDIRCFPLHLRRWIEIPYRMNACSFVGLVVVFGWGKYIGLLD
ncbi:hypothetical protein [Pseudomonas sp.]|uniref:hypothetical protein n=1 Tax=Pseudomonas sp. TaxID=306 RepID=UPI003F3D205F